VIAIPVEALGGAKSMKTLCVVLFVVIWIAGCDSAVNYADMRRYIVSKLTDQQIRDLHKLAEQDREQALTESADETQRAQASAAKKAALCADVVYRTRHDCTPGYHVETPEVPSVERFFELRLMGVCMFVNKRSEAVEKGCLPK
jgi:hypothetical protein